MKIRKLFEPTPEVCYLVGMCFIMEAIFMLCGVAWAFLALGILLTLSGVVSKQVECKKSMEKNVIDDVS